MNFPSGWITPTPTPLTETIIVEGLTNREFFERYAAPGRIVFTDVFDAGWQPSPDAFFTAITTLKALPGGKTRYTARALHWTVANRDKHEKMGFHQNWGESLDGLVSLVVKT